jgi:hypothetical protein
MSGYLNTKKFWGEAFYLFEGKFVYDKFFVPTSYTKIGIIVIDKTDIYAEYFYDKKKWIIEALVENFPEHLQSISEEGFVVARDFFHEKNDMRFSLYECNY